jgi:hypothetical protein
LKGGSLNDLTRDLRNDMRSAEKKPAPTPAREREEPVMTDDDGDDL